MMPQKLYMAEFLQIVKRHQTGKQLSGHCGDGGSGHSLVKHKDKNGI